MVSPANDNADWGRTIECAACERWPLRRVSDDVHAYDVVFTEGFAGDTPADHVLEGTPAECKACRKRVSNGAGDRPGRWWVRESAHRTLLEAGGWYVLAVYTESEGIVRMARLEADRVDDRLAGRWTSCGSDHPADRSAQLPWTDVFDVQVIRTQTGP